MENNKIIELISYTIPAIITGLTAYYFFYTHTKNEENKLKLSMVKENQKQALPLRLQAFERMALFLERINPNKLLVRVNSINNDKNAYVYSLIDTIEQEFEHNLTQQIYITDKCWNVIIASKNATIQLIKTASEDDSVTNAQELKEAILQKMVKSTPPTNTALAYIKDEVRSFL